LGAAIIRFGNSAWHLCRYFAGLDQADTQTTGAERACLAEVAQGRRRAVEIGVYEGVGTRTIANCMDPNGTLYAVDPFVAGRLGICWNEWIARREIGKARGRVELVRAFSHEAVRQIRGSFDLLFIDGDHSDEGIVRDWHDWSPRIEQGGIVALHDTRPSPLNPGVENLGSYRYFESDIRHDPRFRLKRQVDTLSILERVG
jgi:predicted O-methyltransferase YrrM